MLFLQIMTPRDAFMCCQRDWNHVQVSHHHHNPAPAVGQCFILKSVSGSGADYYESERFCPAAAFRYGIRCSRVRAEEGRIPEADTDAGM